MLRSPLKQHVWVSRKERRETFIGINKKDELDELVTKIHFLEKYWSQNCYAKREQEQNVLLENPIDEVVFTVSTPQMIDDFRVNFAATTSTQTRQNTDYTNMTLHAS